MQFGSWFKNVQGVVVEEQERKQGKVGVKRVEQSQKCEVSDDMVLEFIASSGQGAAMELRLVGEMQRAGHVAVGDRLTYVSSSEDSRRKKGTRKTRLPSLKPLLSYGVLSKRIEMENLEKQFQST